MHTSKYAVNFQIKSSFCTQMTKRALKNHRNVSFPGEAIQGINFFSAQVDSFLYHKWPKATSDMKLNHQVLRKGWFLELPHPEKAFSKEPLIN